MLTAPSSQSAVRVGSKPAPLWPLFVALLPFAALAAYHWNWGAPPGFGDHAQYLAHAKAIVEGRPYTDIGYIYHPAAPMLAPRAYPPGLPLTLAPIVALAGVDSPFNKLLMLASVVLFAVLVYRRLALVLAPWQAALAAAFSAVALEARFGTIVPLSDAGFCALLWGLVLAVDTAAAWTWRRVSLITALGFATMSYRVPGVVVLPALALYALMNWREHRARALVPVAIWGAAGFALLASGFVDIPFRRYLLPGPGDIADRMTSMIRVYKAAIFDLEIYPFGREKLNDAYHAIASLAVLTGSAAFLWRYRRTMMTATFVAYIAMLCVSPVSDGRYLWPLYPVFAAGLVVGATAASKFVGKYVSWYPRSAAPVALALSLILVAGVWRDTKVPAQQSLDRLPDAERLFTWLRERQAREPMRAMFHNPRVLSLKTGVATMGALALSPAAHLEAIRETRISHIVWQNAETNACRSRLLNALPRLYPDRFVLEYENPSFRVYRVLPRSDPLSNETRGRFEVTPEICRDLPRA